MPFHADHDFAARRAAQANLLIAGSERRMAIGSAYGKLAASNVATHKERRPPWPQARIL
jgi:hypothetical protein